MLTKLENEISILKIMVKLYCRNHHHSAHLCELCNEVLNYAKQRVGQCKWQEEKPACAQCTVHCFKPIFRNKIQEMMRYAGPRMIYKHPIITLNHYVHKLIYFSKNV